MRPCQDCWSALRNAIALRGLEPLVAKDGREAAQRTFEGYEPLIAPMLRATALLAEKIGARVAHLGNDACQFCELRKHDGTVTRDQQMNALADFSREEAQRRGEALMSAKPRSPAALRALLRAGLARVGRLSPALDAKLAATAIPEREARPKPEARGMSEKAMLAVRADEIAWFALHPTEQSYYRRLVPGEFPPDVTAEWVRVTKIDASGQHRVREPVVRTIGPAGLEWRDWRGDQ